MGQDEQLLDVVTGNLRIQVLSIVPADIDHLTDDCADEEQGRAIHTGHRVIDNDDLFLELLATHAATYLMIEVQESDEVALALTEIFRNGAVLTDNFINILHAFFRTNAEALETRILQNLVDAVDGGLGVRIVLIQGGDLICQVSDFFSELLATLGNVVDFLLKSVDLILIALHVSRQHERKILHDFRLAFALAGYLGRNNIVIGLDLLIDFVDHSTNFQQKRIGVFKGNGL